MNRDGEMAEAAIADLLDRCRVVDGAGFRMALHATAVADGGHLDKHDGKALLEGIVAEIAALQERLYADARWSVLVVLQAMDAGGKDGTIKHVFSGVNPQGVTTVSFKAPTTEELAHDFLWRIHRALPARGSIGVFNRSHYEEVVVARVHPGLLDAQRLPPGPRDDAFWAGRLGDIRAFESYLARQGTRIVKVFLNIGEEEQRKRLLARLDDPTKHWKFDAGDLKERARWPDYRAAYEAAIGETASADAPWFVVPADSKWLARLLVAAAVRDALRSLDLPSRVERGTLSAAEIAAAREQLQAPPPGSTGG